MASSADVSSGDLATAAQYNNLRADVLNTSSGHTHTGTDSKNLGTLTADLTISQSGASQIEVISTANDAYLILNSDTDEGQDSEIIFESGGTARGRIEYNHHATANTQLMSFFTADNAVETLKLAGNLATFATAVDLGSNTLTTTGSLQVRTIDWSDGDLAMTIADGGGVTFAQAVNITGSLTTTDGIRFGNGGSYGAGGLYADSNWGVIITAFTASPGASDILFEDAGGTNLATLDGTTGLTLLVGNTTLPGDSYIAFGDTNHLIDVNTGYMLFKMPANEDFYWQQGSTNAMFLDTSTNTLLVGTHDTAEGMITIAGGASGNGGDQFEGGELRLHTAADHDGTYDYYFLDAYQDDLRIGRAGNVDVSLSAAGSFSMNTPAYHYDDVHFDGVTASRDVIWDRSDNRLEFQDNTYLSFGTGADTKMYHTGASFYEDTETHYFTNSASYRPILQITNSNADNTSGYLDFVKASASPAAGDVVGVNRYIAYNDAAQSWVTSTIYSQSVGVTDGAEEGNFAFQVMMGGTLTTSAILDTTAFHIGQERQLHETGSMITRNFVMEDVREVTNVTSWATQFTITPSVVDDLWTRGHVEFEVMGHTSSLANGSRYGRWYFDIADAAPTAAVGNQYSVTNGPDFRLSISGNTILCQVQSGDGSNRFDGTLYVKVVAASGAGDNGDVVTYTLT